jgi:hypothetical protein
MRHARSLLLLLWVTFGLPSWGASPVYVTLWFDTEDYVEPKSDDAALRIARNLDGLGVHATFKMVGEKVRVLQSRGRSDVLRALARHDIGYHTEKHSAPPTPAVYLREMGFLDGAEEFLRRETAGLNVVERAFGVVPSCYGQPGESWAPQVYPALRRMGIGVYIDDGVHLGLDEQPFWYGGLLHIFHMGRNLIRPDLDGGTPLAETLKQFDSAAANLAAHGGGVISTYFHPTEFATKEFWDAVNFADGANPKPGDWKRPRLRTPQDSERCYEILRSYVEHAKGVPGVRFVTARELLQLYTSGTVPGISRAQAASQLSKHLNFAVTEQGTYSAADLLVALLGLEPQYVDGPDARKQSSLAGDRIPREAFERAQADAAAFIRAHHRLPSLVWIGAQALSLPDFAATLAADDGRSDPVQVRKGTPEFERYLATDPEATYRWPIHPKGFRAPELLDLGRLQAWTLKPARLR